jgi:hypothetical protein
VGQADPDSRATRPEDLLAVIGICPLELAVIRTRAEIAKPITECDRARSRGRS